MINKIQKKIREYNIFKCIIDPETFQIVNAEIFTPNQINIIENIIQQNLKEMNND